MDKRALLAALLSAVVLVIWFALFPAQPRDVGRGPVEVAPPGGGAVGAVPTAAPAPAPAAPDAPGPISGGIEEDIRLSGDGWVAVLSTRGGVVRSFVLTGYEADDRGPLELVRAGDTPPLSLAAAGPWNEGVYALSREGQGVVLRWSDGTGDWVEKRVAPGAGRFALEIEVRGGGRAVAGGVVIGVAGLEKVSSRPFGSVGGVARVAGDMDRFNPTKLDEPQVLRGPVEYVGVERTYFLLVLLPEAGLSQVRVEPEGVGAETGARMIADGSVVRGTLYGGPKEHRILTGYGRGLDETLSFGFFGMLSVGFLAALRWIHSWTANWGLAIIVLTAAIRILLFPLTHKSTVAMRRMQALQPKMKAIQERYKERAKKDPQVRARMNQELMGLYKQEGVNPMGGCLPTLVQLPILWALYTLFANAIELRHAPFIFWIQDLSAKDPTYITPILMTASMVLQQRLAPQMGDPTQRRMFMMMPFIFGFMFMSFPAGLVLYWLVNNVLTIAQQLLTERLLRTVPAKAA